MCVPLFGRSRVDPYATVLKRWNKMIPSISGNIIRGLRLKSLTSEAEHAAGSEPTGQFPGGDSQADKVLSGGSGVSVDSERA